MLGLVEHLFITEQPGLINHSAVNITAEMKSCIDGLREGKKKARQKVDERLNRLKTEEGAKSIHFCSLCLKTRHSRIHNSRSGQVKDSQAPSAFIP